MILPGRGLHLTPTLSEDDGYGQSYRGIVAGDLHKTGLQIYS